ncbi:MAG: iron ABC transporter permease [Trueperaceae bacterium]|nr:iron ABC transporter permease [Trueperaceae bacterium]
MASGLDRHSPKRGPQSRDAGVPSADHDDRTRDDKAYGKPQDRSALGRFWALVRALQRGSDPAVVMVTLALLIVVAVLVSLNLGFIKIPPVDVLKTFFGQGTSQQELVLFQFRLPRIVLALLVGGSLALSGAILQSVSQNGLADPGILGINAGAGLAVVGLLIVGTGSSAFLLPAVAFLGAAATAALIYALAYKDGSVTPSRLLLVGIAINAGIAATILVLSMRMDRQLYSYAVAWLSGTIAGTSWDYVFALLPWTLLLVPLTFAKARTLDVLSLGDMLATGLGAAVERQRLILLGVAVALAGSAVAVGGGIGFVGLVGPHLARRLVGPNHRVMLPTTALAGALLLVVADSLARNLFAPVEMPVGVVVAAIGAPYFLYLLAKTRG